MKQFISWDEYDGYIDSIANWVSASNLNLVGIYGLPRGGLPMAVSLSHKLGLPLLLDYYDRRIIKDVSNVNKVLVVDDIADTGETLKKFSPLHNVICTFHYHKQSIVTPDYWVHEKGDDWIVYPWELVNSNEIQDYLI
tara:strand:- start:2830 stop:3243 length:414 start_codon:yes stop_codon:yes gene_type:complete